MSDAKDYQVVPTNEEESRGLISERSKNGSHRAEKLFREVLAKAPALWAIGSFFLMVTITVSSVFSSNSHRDYMTYSPAKDTVRYHKVVWDDNLHHKSKYMGEPTPELDAAWEEEYDLIAKISKHEADKLEYPADEIPGVPGNYAVMLDIFHSLHCLNVIRKEIHQDYYGPAHVNANSTKALATKHMDHCIEAIRLALWCNADISPISFQQKGAEDGLSASHYWSHTCRDPEPILEWARARRVTSFF